LLSGKRKRVRRTFSEDTKARVENSVSNASEDASKYRGHREEDSEFAERIKG